MPVESSTPGTIGAQRQYENIQRKLSSIGQTIKRLQELGGLPSPIVDRIDDLNRRQVPIAQKTRSLWARTEQPISDANNLLNNAKQKLEQNEPQLGLRKDQSESLQRQLAAQRDALKRAPDNVHVKQSIDSMEQQLQSNIAEIDSLTARLQGYAKDVAAAQTIAEEAQKKFNSFCSDPNAEFDNARREVDELVEDARKLHDEATRDRTLAEAGLLVKTNSQQFEKAMTHHRTQAFYLLLGTVVAVFGLAIAIAFVFQLWPTMERPVVEAKVVDASQPKQDLAHILMVFGGRISVIAGAAWVVVFLGKLHARHSQQAVSYQDRLAGLDVIGVMLQHGTQETRDVTMKRLTEFYLTQEDNAFRDPPTREPSLKDVERLLRSVTKPVGEAVKAVAGGVAKRTE